MLTHIVLSDFHAGAQNSLLMDIPDGAENSSVSQTFAAALGGFLKTANRSSELPRPKLVLLGDTLDLQFSGATKAMQNATLFLQALAETNQFDPCVMATAGNHDHALWTDARLGLEITPGVSDNECRATRAFAATSAAKSRMLQAVLERAGFKTQDFRYPNIGLTNETRSVLLHHGHFTEAEYLTISHLIDAIRAGGKRTHSVADIAAENAGWIDFFWPGVGQTGLSRNASNLYQALLTPSGFRRVSARLTEILSKHLGDALPLSGNLKVRDAIRMTTRLGLDATLGRFRDTSRYYETAALSPSGQESLLTYLQGPVATQVLQETETLSKALTFVFGHTHKPFADRMSAPGYDIPIDLHNVGGWTLNGPRLDNREGASMVLIDDALNVAQVQLFSTSQNGVIPPPRVLMLGDQSAGATTFKETIEGWMAATQPEWQALTDAAGETYQRLQAKLLALTEPEVKTDAFYVAAS